MSGGEAAEAVAAEGGATFEKNPCRPSVLNIVPEEPVSWEFTSTKIGSLLEATLLGDCGPVILILKAKTGILYIFFQF